MGQRETDRIDAQRISLGPEGLQIKATELENAMDTNNVLPPEEMLRQVPIPSPDSINFHSLTKFTSQSVNTPAGLNLNELPCYAEFYDLHSNFVYVNNIPILSYKQIICIEYL